MKKYLFAFSVFCLGAIPAANAGLSFAYDIDSAIMDEMTPIKCEKAAFDPYIDRVSVANDCGTSAICSGNVDCLWVSNKVLKEEFGGDPKKALAGSKTIYQKAAQFFNSTTFHLVNDRPKFIEMSSRAHCAMSPDGSCGTPMSCASHEAVKRVGGAEWSNPGPHERETVVETKKGG